MKKYNLRWRPYIPLLGGLFSGVFLVMAWGAQTMLVHEEGNSNARINQVQAFASPLLTAHPFVRLAGAPPAPQDPELATAETVKSWCGFSRKLWFDVFSKPLDMDLGVYEKSLLKDVYAQSHALGCLSDREFFEVVKNLRYRQTLTPPKPSSVFFWSFAPSWEQHTSAQRLLAVSREQWCRQKEWARAWREDKKWIIGTEITKCQSLSSPLTILSSPE